MEAGCEGCGGEGVGVGIKRIRKKGAEQKPLPSACKMVVVVVMYVVVIDRY